SRPPPLPPPPHMKGVCPHFRRTFGPQASPRNWHADHAEFDHTYIILSRCIQHFSSAASRLLPIVVVPPQVGHSAAPPSSGRCQTLKVEDTIATVPRSFSCWLSSVIRQRPDVLKPQASHYLAIEHRLYGVRRLCCHDRCYSHFDSLTGT